MTALRKIFALVLAFLVLLSSTSFMVGIHVCQDVVQNIAVFTKADGCEMEKKVPPCHRHLTKPCCKDETVVHEADDFQGSTDTIQSFTPLPLDIDQTLILIAEIVPSVILPKVKYLNYDPPLLPEDLTITHQVFLI
ncbi:MAG TPA: hypothetical protein VD927_17025 [Chryseosolibacter sp.]|nr:hypothetical protein [Chryseosolibacter sp.]